jgi:hypothetical protein
MLKLRCAELSELPVLVTPNLQWTSASQQNENGRDEPGHDAIASVEDR